MSDNHQEEGMPREPLKLWVPWSLAILLVMGIGVWFAGPTVEVKTRSVIALYFAEKAEKLIQQSDWPNANEALILASQWQSEHPKVLRVLADFLIGIKAEPASTLHALRRLEIIGQANEADFIQMGKIYTQQENIRKAEETLAKLSPEARQKRPALELLANIQRLQGFSAKAEQTLRHALNLDQNDSMCRYRLAMLDQQASFSEMRQKSRETLWNLTEGKDRAALMAIEFMVKDPNLTTPEADKLLERIKVHPEKTDEIRLSVLSALMRVRPQNREQILNEELARYQKKGAEQLLPVMNWLLIEHEPARVLAMLTKDIFLKSSALIGPYLQALADLERWEELDKTLSRPAGMSVSSGYISLWRARANLHIDKTNINTRQHLNIVYEASGHGRSEGAARAGATIAEEAGLYDVAAQFYEGLAEHQPNLKFTMLEKVYEMSLRGRDTERVLQVARQQLSLRPENPLYVDRVIYLQLVAGYDLELNFKKLLETSHANSDRTEDHLSQALAAYRMGDLTNMRTHLNRLKNVSNLSPGQRAVHAGLLSISGQVGPAFLIAEQIPSILLLKEEKRFLDRAL
jgi:tetratricopeptide (TPR) repeat protein